MSIMIKYTCPMFHFFHEKGKPASIDKEYSITFDTFCGFLDILNKHNIYTLTPEMLISKDIRENIKYTMLTFDDGHKSNIRAAEILYQYGMKGVFYVVKEFCDDPEYCTIEEIKYIHSLGHSIGIHGKNHNMWKNKDKNALIEELSDTQYWLEELLNSKIITCSAPKGGITNKEFEIIEKNIPQLHFIRCSFPGINSSKDSRLYSVGIRNTTTAEMFSKIVIGDFNYYRRIRAVKKVKNFIRPIYNLLTGRRVQ